MDSAVLWCFAFMLHIVEVHCYFDARSISSRSLVPDNVCGMGMTGHVQPSRLPLCARQFASIGPCLPGLYHRILSQRRKVQQEACDARNNTGAASVQNPWRYHLAGYIRARHCHAEPGLSLSLAWVMPVSNCGAWVYINRSSRMHIVWHIHGNLIALVLMSSDNVPPMLVGTCHSVDCCC
jgi:hypothetical protein